MFQPTAVVLDEDPIHRDDLRTRLSRCGILPICFQDEWICIENIHFIKPRLAILRTDSHDCASRFVTTAKAIRSDFPVAVLSEDRETEDFIRNHWLANLLFLRYPADSQDFENAVTTLVESRQDEKLPLLIAGSVPRKRLIQGLPLIGDSKEPVLIQGEIGVGKKSMALAIHRLSGSDVPAEHIDGRDITGDWISEKRRQLAVNPLSKDRQPSIIIENVERLTTASQSQMLDLMDTGCASCAGSDNGLRLPRFISLTTQCLKGRVMGGHFRRDLYHRLNVLKITVPPLKSHPSDILSMIHYFTTLYSIKENGGLCQLPERIVKVLAGYDWPGNVDELKRVIQRFFQNGHDKVLQGRLDGSGQHPVCRRQAKGFSIDPMDVRAFIAKHGSVPLKQARRRYASEVEKRLLKLALVKTNGNCKKAATLLSISYKSMLNKVKEYALNE